MTSGENKLVQVFVVAFEDLLTVPLPGFAALVQKNDMIRAFQDRVHIVGIHHGGDVEFLGQVPNQVVNSKGAKYELPSTTITIPAP